MNRYLIVVAAVVLSTFTLGCEEPLAYKFQSRPQLIECDGLDKALIHEALYSFQEDIANFYNNQNRPLNNETYINGYGNFVQPGLAGTAPYHLMASRHTIEIWNQLKDTPNLWNNDSEDTHLNYEHPFISCLLNAIKDEDLKMTFRNMRDANFMSPKLLAEPLRGEVENIITDPNLAMYVALDGYYQNFKNVKVFINE